MLSNRENFMMAVVEHKVPEWVPNALGDVIMAGGAQETFENGPAGGGLDDFGVEWMATVSAAGQATPAPGKYVLDDITKWEDVVHFPDLDAFDWQGLADAQLAGQDRTQKVVEYGTWNSTFLRLGHLMGFAEAMVAMVVEPEAVNAFYTAHTDYKIGLAERAAKYFKPDFFTHYDDTATERGLFISPEVYRSLIKPHHKRLNDAAKAFGMYPIMHTCGKCEDIIQDFIDEGAVAWTAAQPMNDIAGILAKHHSEFAVMGGYDSNGRPGSTDATDAEIDAEVRRCIEQYAPYGSFVMMGFKLVASMDPMAFFAGMQPINEAVEKYKHCYN